MRYAFIRDYCTEYPQWLALRVLDVSRSGYNDWLHRLPSNREQGYQAIDQRITDAFAKGRGTYGVERVREELQKQGHRHGDKLIRKRMCSLDLVAEQKRSSVRTTDSNHNEPIAANLLERDFQAPRPNMVYVGDITYIPYSGGWIYLATVIDLFSRSLVGWELAEKMDIGLISRALHNACRHRDLEEDWIFHSDRGSQYASREYRALLETLGCRQSMSRKGDCWDNAVAESFNGALKREWLYRRHRIPETIKIAELELFDYIECFYNRIRIHSYLDFVSPAEFEEAYFEKNQAA